jgi:hypothetical protein
MECGDLSPLLSYLVGPLTKLACISPSFLRLYHSVEKIWPHAPVHQLGTFGVYMVTGGTLYKEHVFRGAKRLTLLEAHLLRIASEHHWQLEAWAVFPNHYHFIARSEPECCDLGKFVKHLHSDTARAW